MFQIILILVTFQNIVLFANQCLAKDATFTEGITGLDVVEAVVKKIKDSGIFTDDKGILKRIAYVESRFGENNTVIHKDTGGGIWQINKTVYDEIALHWDSNKILIDYLPKIDKILAINIKEGTFENLKKPIYSGIFARLHLFFKGENIPDFTDVEGQARYWKKYYNKNGTEQKFVDDVNKMEKQYECQGRMDLAIVMDASGSIGDQSYMKAKTFVADLVQTFSLETVNIGFVVFSNEAKVVFNLTSNQNITQMKKTIMDSVYLRRDTCTEKGINKAINILTNVTHREGVPKIMAIFTDGKPNCNNEQLHNELDQTVKNNITTFAIGIGQDIDQGNLLAFSNNNNKHVFTMSSYEVLSKSFSLMNSETCKIPQKPIIGKNLTDVLVKREKRFFHFHLPHEGITIKINIHLGKTRGYYSYTLENPSSAMNDGEFDGQIFIPYREPKSNRRKRDTSNGATVSNVFVTVQGVEDKSKYTIASEQGNHVSAAMTTTLNKFSLFSIIFFFFYSKILIN